MSNIEQLFLGRPLPQRRVPSRIDRRAASDRLPKYDKSKPSLPRREAAQRDLESGQGSAIRTHCPTPPQQLPSAPRWYVSISAMVMLLLSKIRYELEIRQAMAELRGLDDRMLRDIGLSRCDIASVRRRDT
jgi:uncharacterized protein YjiS (DUF1127 family)